MKFRTLRADEIECRVATISEKGAVLLLYKDARVDQNILDETVGSFNWQRKHEVIHNNLYCSVGIYNEDRAEWVWKEDVGTESYTEPQKGEASDAFKRACFNWGIGRELYTAPFIFIPAGKVNLVQKNGKVTTYDRFKVGEIDYKDGRICYLTIIDKKGEIVYAAGQPKVEEEKAEEIKKQPINGVYASALVARCNNFGVDVNKLLALHKVDAVEKLTMTQWQGIVENWDKVMEKCKAE